MNIMFTVVAYALLYAMYPYHVLSWALGRYQPPKRLYALTRWFLSWEKNP